MKSYKEALAIKVWDLALKGTRWAAEFVRDTAYGKPIQKMEHGGFDGEAINLTFTTGTGPGPEERD